MATIDDLNALNIRPRTRVFIRLYDSGGNELLYITENNLIRATVSLRSDLSRTNPTLPESEMEIEAYYDTDISDVLAAAGERLKIRYSWKPAGASNNGKYRTFYTDERITWNDKVLHIHAVDNIGIFDEELPPIYLGQIWLGNNSISDSYVIRELWLYFNDMLSPISDPLWGSNYQAIGETSIEGTFASVPTGGALNSIVPRGTRRAALAKIMNLMHWEFDSGTLSDRDSFWPVYVDAGEPKINNVKPSAPAFVIKAEDCGNFKTSKEPNYNEISATVTDIEWSGYRLKQNTDMTATMFKQKGMAMSFRGLISDYRVGLSQSWEGPNGVIISGWFYETAYESFDAKERTLPYNSTIYPNNASWMKKNEYGMWLLDESPEVNPLASRSLTYLDLSGAKWTTSGMDGTVPGETPADCWSDWVTYGSLDASATDAELETRSHFFLLTNDKTLTRTKVQPGNALDITGDAFWNGTAKMRKYDDSGEVKLLPEKALDCILEKSNIIGSFTWKGHPNLQPRDVIQLNHPIENLRDQDGVDLQNENGEDLLISVSQLCTVENITTTHEGGGTISEITYREGIV